MKIFVTGTRGIPDIPGGIEKHCQEIYPLMANKGHEVYLSTRKPYLKHLPPEWRGVRLFHLYAPRQGSLEAILHTFLSVLKARRCRPDILHIHAIGPGLLTPVARVLGMKVVVTYHGPDYDRVKWGGVARAALRVGELFTVKWAHGIIAVSPYIRDLVQKKYGRDTFLIPNGVRIADKRTLPELPEGLGLEAGSYMLAVSRVEPGKGLKTLVQAFSEMKMDLRLVIAGYTNYESAYEKELRTLAARDSRVVFAYNVPERKMEALYTNASLFVQPSFHEGLPLTLLQAMSHGLPILVSDIAAHKAVELPEYRYFKVGDVQDLKRKLEELFNKGISETEKENMRRLVEEQYNWEKIAEQTIEVYEKVLREKC